MKKTKSCEKTLLQPLTDRALRVTGGSPQPVPWKPGIDVAPEPNPWLT